jgi:hypothetical protein
MQSRNTSYKVIERGSRRCDTREEGEEIEKETEEETTMVLAQITVKLVSHKGFRRSRQVARLENIGISMDQRLRGASRDAQVLIGTAKGHIVVLAACEPRIFALFCCEGEKKNTDIKAGRS